MVAAAEPYVRRLKLDRLRPGRLVREMFDSGSELFHLLREIPGGFRDLLRLAKRGALKINFEHRGLDKLIETHERVANRLSFAIVAAALIVGSSTVINSKVPPLWGDMSVIGLAGFLFAGAMGFVLLISILRHGRL
jgi:ubiquinone biosynthesis protein